MSKKLFVINILILFLFVITACASAVDQSSQGEEDAQWAEIVSRGTLLVGTAADYPPFSYVNNGGQLDGFDVALIRDIARRLGLTAEISNFAFEGVISAVYINQIDVGIAALSVTPDRQNFVDFTNLYFAGQEGILAKSDGPVTSINTLDQFGSYRVAAQRGSVYQDYIQKNLVDAGRLDSANFFVYEQPSDAVRDLREGRVDLVVLDLLPAQEFVDGRIVRLVGQGLIPQQFALAVKKVSMLTEKINKALAEAQSDGTINMMDAAFLNGDMSSIPPAPTSGGGSNPPPTENFDPDCVYGMEWVAYLNYDDQNMTYPPVLQPGESFSKGWRLRNTGTCDWDTSFYLSFAGGNVPAAQMNGKGTAMPTNVPVGGEVDVYVDFIAPTYPGIYQGFWQMTQPNGTPFGMTVYAGISIPGNYTEPSINYFYTDPNEVKTGGCTVVYWDVSGEVNNVTLTNNSGASVWDPAPVNGNYKECYDNAGSYYFRLTVTGPGGTAVKDTVVVVKQKEPPKPQLPEIMTFGVRPREILLGNCATFTWDVRNANSVVLSRDGEQIGSYGANGTMQDCPPSAGQLTYKLTAKNGDGSDSATASLLVNGPPKPEPRLQR